MQTVQRLGILLAIVVGLSIFSTGSVHAQEGEHYYKARVSTVVKEETDTTAPDGLQFHQQVRLELLSGPDERSQYVVDYYAGNKTQRLNTDEVVVAVKMQTENGSQYNVADQYRLNRLTYLLIGFLTLTIIFARWRGISSLLGLAISVLVLAKFVVPRIIAGSNPLFISLIGALIIAVVSIYLAHGFSKRTSVALVSTLLTIGISVLLAALFVPFAKLFGIGTEDAFQLQLNNINLQGLLMGGIIIGALGVLNDITTAQAAAVDEIHQANPALSPRELFKRGQSVGREHITSLINTLALAYVGASFPLLLLFTLYPRPLWVIINSEQVMEEIVRTLVGSLTLIVAVPITTFLAAYFLTKKELKQ